MVLAEIGTHGVLDARLGGYRDGERSLAYPLAGSTGPGDLVIADRGFWSVEFAHVFTAAGADLLVRLQSNHLGTVQGELSDGSYLSLAQPGLSTRDQETEPLACAEDPCQTRHGPVRPLGPQPDLEAEEHPQGRKASTQRIAFLVNLGLGAL
ncbi:hypothetical protein ABZ135_11195 [Streptomyces sp. NPDC006339]|uniref:hypothetical protein n=1 Tax=Streptomyces sp. NPDC006339 TaxID=3156755 RepID=UPI0033A8F9CC